jgi:hypothetical protein
MASVPQTLSMDASGTGAEDADVTGAELRNALTVAGFGENQIDELVSTDEVLRQLVEGLAPQQVVLLTKLPNTRIADFAAAEVAERPNRKLRAWLLDAGGNGRAIMREHDRNGKNLTLFPHQCEAVRMLLRQNATASDKPRSALLMLWHEMGLGKTATGMACIAAVNNRLSDPAARMKCVIVSPIAVASFHVQEALRWLRLPSDAVLLARSKDDLSQQTVERAQIIVVTYSTLVAALATFVWKNPRARQTIGRKSGKVRWFAEFELLTVPRRKDLVKNPDWNPNAPPPMHPIFAVPKWDVVVIDEAQRVTNPTTWNAKAVRRLCSRSVHRILGSGTPVRGKVSQMAGYEPFTRTPPFPAKPTKIEQTPTSFDSNRAKLDRACISAPTRLRNRRNRRVDQRSCSHQVRGPVVNTHPTPLEM